MMSRRQFGRAALAGLATPSLAFEATAKGPGDSERYRPKVHYSPPTGFMNDPNGLLYADGEYHLFYQFNPFEPKAGHVHWGHAVSRDLTHWTTLPNAVKETPVGQAFSGSAVKDPATGEIVAVYTRASETRQTQEIATSRDNGRSFAEYPGNPVLDIGSGSFRDPKVLWHAPTRSWVMATVHARAHRVVLYGSPDLRRWTELSRFGPMGVTGVDYECPDLVFVPVEGERGGKWVLFVSINPGAPQGGSAVQYFVGEFDGRAFVPDEPVVRLVDFGKDFYALQTYADAPDGPVAIAWMSNWQYCDETPTGAWRGVMSLPRKLSLRRAGSGHEIVQSFVGIEGLKGRILLSGAAASRTGEVARASVPKGEALEVRLRAELEPGAAATLRFGNGRGERLDVGYDAKAAQFFLDRGGARGFPNRFFTDKASGAAEPGTRKVDLQIAFDRCTLELLAMRGVVAASALHFFDSPVDRVSLLVEGAAVVEGFEVTTLRKSVG